MYYRDEFIEPIDYEFIQSKEDACIDFLRDLAESITAYEREYAIDWAMDELGMNAYGAERAVDDAFAALIKWSEESDELPCGRYDAMVWMGACMIDEETIRRYNETQRGW